VLRGEFARVNATAFKKLINRVKAFEDELKFQKSKSKRRRLTLVTSEDEEDLGRYGQNLETQEGFGDGQKVSTAAQEVSIAPQEVSIATQEVSTASPQRNADTTIDYLTLAKTLIEIRKSAAKDKGKAKMDETESPRKMKQRERAQISRDEEGFTDAEWDDVLARVAADKQRAEAKRNKLMTPAQQKDYMYPIIDWEVYSEDTKRDELVKIWDLFKERLIEPTNDKEKELWVELKRLFKPDNDDILWKLQRGHDIFMLVEKEYPLTRGTLGLMMVARLLVEVDRSGYQQKDRKPSQNDKTEHGMEKTVQNQGQSPKKVKVKVKIQKNQQSNRSRN
ncbi:hypothetical protein Tco_1436520, partial [Tanacetum coccineum]